MRSGVGLYNYYYKDYNIWIGNGTNFFYFTTGLLSSS